MSLSEVLRSRVFFLQKRMESFTSRWEAASQTAMQEFTLKQQQRRVYHTQWVEERFGDELFVRLSRQIVGIFEQSKATSVDMFVDYVNALDDATKTQRTLLCVFFAAVYQKSRDRYWTISNDFNVVEFEDLINRYLETAVIVPMVARTSSSTTAVDNVDVPSIIPPVGKSGYYCEICDLHFQYQGRWEQHHVSKYHKTRVLKRQRKD